MSKFHKQSENMKALEQSLNDHMEICSLERQVKRLNAKNARLKAEVERLREAGDAMAKVIDDDYLNTLQVWSDWNAAKEGKPSV